MEEQIPEEVKNKRKNILMEIQSRISLEKNKQMIGKNISLMVEGLSKDKKYYGRSYGDAPEIDQTIFIDNAKLNIKLGEIFNIKVTKAYTYDLVGDEYYEFSK
jgi:ribosomal protein S12 methylthiotransferase